MKILLINSPIRTKYPPSNIPHGLAIIANVLRREGYEVDILDANIVRTGFLLLLVSKLCFSGVSYDIIGISGLITTYEWQKNIISWIKRNFPEKHIIAGGGCATSIPNLMTSAGADYIILGEGEEIFKDHIKKNGLIYRSINERSYLPNLFPDLDSLPYPAWDLLDMKTYLSNPFWGAGTGNSTGDFTFTDYMAEKGELYNTTADVITSRGCPSNCNFCWHLCTKYRQRSVKHVIGEVLELKKRYNTDFAGFIDDNMMVNKSWMLEFCAEMASMDIRWGCHGRVNNTDKEILDKMVSAGCRWIGYGIESGSQKILDLMNKRTTVEQAKKAILLAREAGLYVNTTFIYGYPGETKKTINESIQFRKELNITTGSFYATPYPGTQLFEQTKNKILSKFNTLEEYVLQLDDADKALINLTDFRDCRWRRNKEKFDSNEEIA